MAYLSWYWISCSHVTSTVSWQYIYFTHTDGTPLARHCSSLGRRKRKALANGKMALRASVLVGARITSVHFLLAKLSCMSKSWQSRDVELFPWSFHLLADLLWYPDNSFKTSHFASCIRQISWKQTKTSSLGIYGKMKEKLFRRCLPHVKLGHLQIGRTFKNHCHEHFEDLYISCFLHCVLLSSLVSLFPCFHSILHSPP